MTVDAREDYEVSYEDEDWDGPEDDCCHEEAELNWEGLFECSCGHSWWATTDQQNAYWEFIDQANRPPTLWERLSDWWLSRLAAMRRPLHPHRAMKLDDEIPF